MLIRAVGVEEIAGDVHDGLTVPVHHEAVRIGDPGHGHGIQILFRRQRQELFDVSCRYAAGHSLLGFGDGEFGAVQSFVLLRHEVQIDIQTVRQFADGDGYAACAEVVAALDEPRRFAVAEQSLHLSFFGCVALLDFRAAGLDGVHVVGLGSAGGAADAVTARAAAQQDDHVAGSRNFSADVLRGRCRYDCAELHSLRYVTGVVDLFHDAGGQADLVAVGGVARCCGLGELLLGDLAGKRFAQGPRRVRCAAHAHRCIDVRSAGERIADDAAGAGGCAAEGLDLGRMIVGFVLEEKQPGFFLAVDIYGHLDGAGVDLVGFVQLVHLALLLELFGCDGAQVHQADGLRAAQILAGLEVVVPGVLEQLVLEGNAVDDLSRVVRLIVIDVDARAVRRDINCDVMAGSVNKILSKTSFFYVIS